MNVIYIVRQFNPVSTRRTLLAAYSTQALAEEQAARIEGTDIIVLAFDEPINSEHYNLSLESRP